MLISVLILGALGVAFGLGLGWAALRFRVEADPVVDRIDALLPQTQCGQCGFPGCRPYAEAIARDEADINQCPPGGEATIQALANLLGKDPKPLNPEHGEHKEKTVVVIDENVCIGCGVCGLVCDPDAIKMEKRAQHVIHPETTFERVILQCLERGTLQNQLFDEPDRVSHKVMRGIVGGFLRLPPVKKALMSDALRSRFLATMAAGAAAKGGAEVARL